MRREIDVGPNILPLPSGDDGGGLLLFTFCAVIINGMLTTFVVIPVGLIWLAIKWWGKG